MLNEQLSTRVRATGRMFERTTSCLTEEDSGFSPAEGTYTVAAHVEHAAGTIDWFIAGMFDPAGFDLDFERHVAEAKACTSLEAAREHFRRSIEDACKMLASRSDQELAARLPEDSLLGPVPRAAAIDGLVDHTAHHRGALAVCARLLGRVPQIPYA